MKLALRTLFEDLLSTIVFVALFAITGNALLTTAIGVGVGIGQIAIETLRGRPVAAMQWLSMGLVLVFGGLSLITNDSRFIMVKPTLAHFAIGAVMLKRGWLDRYLPEAVHRYVPQSVIIGSGYAWALSMFAFGVGNLFVAMTMSRADWALFNTVVPLVIEFGGFALQYVLFRVIVRHNLRREAVA
jgi:intracellular septation protein A